MSTTVHVVQSFTLAKGALKPDPQRMFQSADEAISAAKRLAMRKDGVVAPASARGKSGEADQQIEVDARHNELVSHPASVRAIIHALR